MKQMKPLKTKNAKRATEKKTGGGGGPQKTDTSRTHITRNHLQGLRWRNMGKRTKGKNKKPHRGTTKQRTIQPPK